MFIDRWVVRQLGWLGLLFVVVLIVALGTGTGYQPNWNASGAAIITHYDLHNTRELVSFYWFAAALCLLFVFIISLAYGLRRVTEQTVLPAIVFGGGILFVAGSMFSGAATVGLIEGSRKSMSAATAETLQALSNTIAPVAWQIGGLIIAVAAGFAIIIAREGWSWVGVLSVVIGLLLMVGPVGLAPFVLLMPLLGFVVARIHSDGEIIVPTNWG